jgi:hypothetical protein
MMSEAQLIEATFVYLGLCGEAFYIAEKAITAIMRSPRGFGRILLSRSYLQLFGVWG